MSQSAKVTLQAAIQQSQNTDLSTAKDTIDYSKVLELLDGTGADQADVSWSDQRTITGSGSDDIDLSALTDAFGNSIGFSSVKAVILVASADNGGTLEVGAGANGLDTLFADVTDALVVRPGGFFAVGAADATGYAVTVDTADVLSVANNDASAATYDIIIIGVAS